VYFKKHLPFELVYDPTLTQGNLNYKTETVDLSFKIASKPTDGFKVIQNITEGLFATGKKEAWGLRLWPVRPETVLGLAQTNYPTFQRSYREYATASGSIGQAHKEMRIEAELFNEQGKSIAHTTQTIINYLGFPLWGNGSDPYESIVLALPMSTSIVFRNVNGNDITDHVTVKITHVNGIDAETAGRTGYIKISTGDTSVDVQPYQRIQNRIRQQYEAEWAARH
jgi:hypothetical protein